MSFSRERVCTGRQVQDEVVVKDDNGFQVRGVFGDFKVRMQKSALQLRNVIIPPHPLGGGVE